MRRLRIITYVVLAYLALAIVWWAILLLRKNNEAFESKSAAARLTYNLQEKSPSFEESLTYSSIQDEYQRQRIMIYGEASVFIVALFFGLWLINRGYTRELEATNQKRNFLLAITHEFKSPLTSIKLILQSLERMNFSAAQQDQLCKDGTLEVDRLNSLVDNILLAARLDKSYHPLYEETDLQSILDNISSYIGNKYPQVKLSVVNEVTSFITIDREGLTSVLHNLTDNAAKYSPFPAEVEIRTSLKQSSLQLSVADQGVGIPAREKNKIFSQFYRSGNEETRGTQGTGLGLYLVQKLVNIYGGSIGIEDNSPKGVIFTVNLPLQ